MTTATFTPPRITNADKKASLIAQAAELDRQAKDKGYFAGLHIAQGNNARAAELLNEQSALVSDAGHLRRLAATYR